jgi:hypothetical protein
MNVGYLYDFEGTLLLDPQRRRGALGTDLPCRTRSLATASSGAAFRSKRSCMICYCSRGLTAPSPNKTSIPVIVLVMSTTPTISFRETQNPPTRLSQDLSERCPLGGFPMLISVTIRSSGQSSFYSACATFNHALVSAECRNRSFSMRCHVLGAITPFWPAP